MIELSTTSPLPRWPPGPETPALSNDEVHVWCARLNQPVSRTQELEQYLDRNERARAGRFYRPTDGSHFVVGRGLLRVILGCYLDIEPSQLRFSYNAYGKPTLVPELGGDRLRFNLSHSHGLVLYAITRTRELGIDLERLRANLADIEIAERFFSPGEVSALRAVSSSEWVEAFFNCWTRKEAYVKARGKGLSLPLDEFDVSLAPGEPAVLLHSTGGPQETNRWSVRELDPAPGYVAALAVEGQDWLLNCWVWV